MCCVLTPTVRLSDTVIYSAQVLHPSGVEPVRVVGYQNHVFSYGSGPSAMVLPLPAEELGPANLVDSTRFSDILGGYGLAVRRMRPVRRSRSDGLLGARFASSAVSKAVVFDSGSYTVVLAKSPAALREGLKAVPERKRPDLSLPMLASLKSLYPDWPVAVCCFDESEFSGEKKLEPLVWWFRQRKDVPGLFAPALDAHGGIPDPSATVHRDHSLAFGTSAAEGLRDGHGVQDYIDQVPSEHRWMFTRGVRGAVVEGVGRNGDFSMPLADVLARGTPDWAGSSVPVHAPPGAA